MDLLRIRRIGYWKITCTRATLITVMFVMGYNNNNNTNNNNNNNALFQAHMAHKMNTNVCKKYTMCIGDITHFLQIMVH